jgi:hypothetical protein
MRSRLKECNGHYAMMEFHADTEQEQRILTAFKNNTAPDAVQLTITSLVERSLLKAGYGECAVVGFEEVQNNIYYIFKIQQINSIGGY